MDEKIGIYDSRPEAQERIDRVHEYTEEQIQHGVNVIKAAGLCGELAPDSSGICLKDPGHKGGHGWEHPPKDAVAQSLIAFFTVERTAEETAAEYLAAYNLRSDQLEEAWTQIAGLRERLEAVEKERNELAGYVRAHLAGNDTNVELQWALDQIDG